MKKVSVNFFISPQRKEMPPPTPLGQAIYAVPRGVGGGISVDSANNYAKSITQTGYYTD